MNKIEKFLNNINIDINKLPEDWKEYLFNLTDEQIEDLKLVIQYKDDLYKLLYLTCELGYEFEDAINRIDDVEFYQDMRVEEVAEELVEEGVLGEISDFLKFYIDYKRLARDLEIDGYNYIPGLGTFRII